MNSNTLSSKPSAWLNKTKVFSISSLCLCSFLMVGCGGSSNNPDEPDTCNTADAAPATGICTAADFDKIRDNLTANYKLLANIDLSKDYSDWTPIGVSSTKSFTGKLDGNGHTISGLNFKNTDNTAQYIGLFGYIGKKAEIKNLSVEVANAGQIALINDNEKYFGVIAGYANNGANLTKITVSSTAPFTIQTGKNSLYAGGIVGVANGAFIEKSSSYVTFNATNSYNDAYAGGIVGLNTDSGAISNSYATGDISANGNGAAYAGGIAGYNDADITNTYTTGDILANDDSNAYAGGIAGYTTNGLLISNSAALNHNVTASGSGSITESRIADGGGTNNFALSTVTLNTRTVSTDNANNADGSARDSLSQSISDWQNSVGGSGGGLGWDFYTIWDWVNNRPVLR